MRTTTRAALLVTAAWLGAPATALAGMPSVSLGDAARLRVQTISFFLMALLLSAWLIKLLWHYLRKDFAFLPRLTYGKPLGPVVLWGLLFVGGRLADSAGTPLAYEPGVYGSRRLVLLTDGEIKGMEVEDILKALPAEGP